MYFLPVVLEDKKELDKKVESLPLETFCNIFPETGSYENYLKYWDHTRAYEQYMFHTVIKQNMEVLL